MEVSVTRGTQTAIHIWTVVFCSSEFLVEGTGAYHVLACTEKGKHPLMTFSHEDSQEASGTSMLIPVHLSRIHWTSVVSFVLGLFFIVCGAVVVFCSVTRVGNAIWREIATTNWLEKFTPVLYTVLLAGALYALVGWVFGLVAFLVARRPAWRKGLALATVGLGLAVLLGVALLVPVLSYLASPCMSADACHIYNQQHH